MPGSRHSERDGEFADREDQWGGPQCGSMDPMQREKIPGNYKQKQNADSDDPTVGARYTYLAPWKTSERGLGQADGGENDEALVSSGLSARQP